MFLDQVAIEDVVSRSSRVLDGFDAATISQSTANRPSFGSLGGNVNTRSRRRMSFPQFDSVASMSPSISVSEVVISSSNEGISNRYNMITDINLNANNVIFRLKQISPVRKYYSPSVTFYAPDYSKEQNPSTRTDFRKTVYWQSNIKTNEKGKAEVLRYHNSDEVSTFRIVLEGLGQSGKVGRAEKTGVCAKTYTRPPLNKVKK